MSRSLIAIEPKLMNRTKERILRGKVDIFLDILPADRSASLPKLNAAAVAHYLDLCRQLDAAAGQPLRTLAAAEMLRLEGVLENQYSASSEETVRLHEEGLLIALDKALDAVVKQRRSEGDALGGALAKLVEGMSEDRLAITAKREGIQKSLYETYRKRLDRLLQAIEETGQKVSSLLPEERLLSEITILTDRHRGGADPSCGARTGVSEAAQRGGGGRPAHGFSLSGDAQGGQHHLEQAHPAGRCSAFDELEANGRTP